MARRVLHIVREEAKQEEFEDVKPSLIQPALQETSRIQARGTGTGEMGPGGKVRPGW